MVGRRVRGRVLQGWFGPEGMPPVVVRGPRVGSAIEVDGVVLEHLTAGADRAVAVRDERRRHGST